jgi:hypothetical protein
MSQVKKMKKKKSKLNRKNFFIYTGVSFAGVYSMLKSPFRLFTHNKSITQEKSKSSIIVKINSHAVKRDIKVKNG